MNRRISAALALLLLLILGLLLWPQVTNRANETARSKSTSPGPNSQWSSSSSQLPSKLPRRDHGPRTTNATHSPEELKNFIIPSLTTKNATVDEALTTLFEQYNEICLNTGETPLKFNYRINGTPSSNLDLNLKQTSFLRALRIIAARSGLTLDRNGTTLVFLPDKQTTADSLSSATYAVPPTLTSHLNALFFEDSTTVIPLGQSDVLDVPKVGSPSDVRAIESSPPLMDLLRVMGIVRSSNASLSYPPGQSKLILEASPADQARLKAFLNEAFLDVRPVQLRTVTKVIDSPEPLSFDSTQFTNAEYQVIMRSLAQTKGVNISSQPSVAARPGETATIEVVREVILPIADPDSEIATDWTGVRTVVHAGGYGFDLQSSITQESRTALDDSPNSIKGVTSTGTQQFPAGSTFLIESTSPQGTPRYIFTTTERLDPSGRPYDPRQPDE